MDYCGTTSGALIENNVIWNNEGWCITILNSDGATIRNNTCYHNGIRQDGSGEISTAGNRLAIYNNILVPHAGQPALNIRFSRSDFTADTSTITENYNLFGVAANAPTISWGDSFGTVAQYKSGNPRGWGAQSTTGDPLFVNSTGGNFHIIAGSPGIDTANPTLYPTVDAESKARPSGARADRGAYEFTSSTGIVLQPPRNLRTVP